MTFRSDAEAGFSVVVPAVVDLVNPLFSPFYMHFWKTVLRLRTDVLLGVETSTC